MSELYPLKFETIFKDKIWGGNKINTILGKDFSPLPNCGETWEISGVEGNISVVSEGPLKGKNLKDLIDTYRDKLTGKKVYDRFGNEFPLLVKFIDANDDLSIQVHPDDKLAEKRHSSFGKTEMWYVFQADPGSKLISGFNRPMDKESYLEHFNNGKLTDILNVEKVSDGDSFFIPAGRVHTIGKGLLLAEIQQTSDITYRIYDFDRTDDQGNRRELHVEEALDAIDYQFYDQYKIDYQNKLNEAVPLASCPYFTTNKIQANQTIERDYTDLDSFVIYVCFDGILDIKYNQESLSVKKGEAILLPACIQKVILEASPDFKILESYIK
ncbi:mannose-6-phosphate isomerase [Fulvivirgaceae bacterium BMA10]|uniref:Phosphohexomutase n=1 Tax=Splendidivirga corallicola TaxID=3051826 RepID=A0ABT8KS06_9BACT|nr:mannose-6-phosphate isomerase [Fulvivirgaceae bacterium BMA10]